jgi:hypothetical protein
MDTRPDRTEAAGYYFTYIDRVGEGDICRILLPADAWLRRGVASDNPFSVRALAYLAAGHVMHHAGILAERYV